MALSGKSTQTINTHWYIRFEWERASVDKVNGIYSISHRAYFGSYGSAGSQTQTKLSNYTYKGYGIFDDGIPEERNSKTGTFNTTIGSTSEKLIYEGESWNHFYMSTGEATIRNDFKFNFVRGNTTTEHRINFRANLDPVYPRSTVTSPTAYTYRQPLTVKMKHNDPTYNHKLEVFAYPTGSVSGWVLVTTKEFGDASTTLKIDFTEAELREIGYKLKDNTGHIRIRLWTYDRYGNQVGSFGANDGSVTTPHTYYTKSLNTSIPLRSTINAGVHTMGTYTIDTNYVGIKQSNDSGLWLSGEIYSPDNSTVIATIEPFKGSDGVLKVEWGQVRNYIGAESRIVLPVLLYTTIDNEYPHSGNILRSGGLPKEIVLEVPRTPPNFTSDLVITNTDQRSIDFLGATAPIMQGYSNIRISLPTPATANYNRGMVRYIATVGDITKEVHWQSNHINIGVPNFNGNVSVQVVAVDTAGLTTTVTKGLYVLPYAYPKIVGSQARRGSGLDTTISISMSGSYNALVVGNTAKNSLTATEYRIRTVGGTYSAWKSLARTTTGESYQTSIVSELNTDPYLAYQVQFKVADAFGNIVDDKVILVNPSIPIWFVDSKKKAVGVNGIPTLSDAFESFSKGYFHKGLLVTSGTLQLKPHSAGASAGSGSYAEVSYNEVTNKVEVARKNANGTSVAVDIMQYTPLGSKRVHNEGNLIIQFGQVSITPVANTPTKVSITFPQAFPSAPEVITYSSTTVPGTTVLGTSSSAVTATGCDIYLTRTTTTTTAVKYTAIWRDV